MPSNINDKILKAQERVKQLERQKKAEEAKNKKRQDGIDKNRQQIVGKLFLETFPEFKELQPQRSMEKNDIEFKPLSDFLLRMKKEDL